MFSVKFWLEILTHNFRSCDWWSQQSLQAKFFTCKTGHIYRKTIPWKPIWTNFWATAPQISSDEISPSNIFLMTNSVYFGYIICYINHWKDNLILNNFLEKHTFKVKNLKDIELQMWGTQVISFLFVNCLQEFKNFKTNISC